MLRRKRDTWDSGKMAWADWLSREPQSSRLLGWQGGGGDGPRQLGRREWLPPGTRLRLPAARKE